MEIKFLGGANEVGRSGFLLKGSRSILLDYGLKIEAVSERPLPSGKVDLCVLSHAHLDHSGYVPAIYENSFPPTVGTPPTLKLAELLIEDSLKLNRQKHEKPLFFKHQFRSFMDRYIPRSYGSGVELDDYGVTLHDAGHISGSAITLIENRMGRRIAYTGDFKLGEQLLQRPAEIVKADALIIESTYAGSEHPDRQSLIKRFSAEVMETVQSGGIALMPVFAVGRAQELLAILYKCGLADRVHLDGMAKAATEIMLMHSDFLANGHLLGKAVKAATVVETPSQRRAALNAGSIIVTTSGMLNGGPVLDYVTKLNRNSRIFLNGYQVEGTNGNKLLANKPLLIDKKKILIKTPVSFYDFSAHAGKSDLHRYIKSSGASTVFCVHGSPENAAALMEFLNEEGIQGYAPNVGDVISLDFD
ncbi:MAG: MBL fold metallo-hydrolase [Candidatus Micrarchaeota archaeon]|nr:MBL fold metallo-hydrolase [Candidatus Micrarchaeota archaeon]